MKFTIDEIIAGWLNVTFDFGDDVYCIMATDIWKTDSARQIIKMMSDALKGSDEYYAVLDNEPGAWVISLNGTGALCIYLCKEDLQGKPDITQCEKAYEAQVDVFDAAHSVYDAFAAYSQGDSKREYENEWKMPFPDEDFSQLGYQLGING